MTRVLVLGASGMLGSMVCDYLSRNPSLSLAATVRHQESRPAARDAFYTFDAMLNLEQQLGSIIERYCFDYVINCIGLINVYCRDSDPKGVLNAIQVNALFPHRLAAFLRDCRPEAKVIHITTDCVFSGRVGHYDEESLHDPLDFYGKSKSLGEVHSDNWLNVRCSIVGPDPRGRTGLLTWFLQQSRGGVVPGFVNHRWNGVTTLQFARFCEELVLHGKFDHYRAAVPTLHYTPNAEVSKYELLRLFTEFYKTGCEIAPRVETVAVDRTLVSRYYPGPPAAMADAIRDLRIYSRDMSSVNM